MDQRDMSERARHAGGEERLTFDPGRPISPWRRTNEGRGDMALVRAERDTRTHAQILLSQNTLETYFKTYKNNKTNKKTETQTFSPFGPLMPGNPL